MGGSVGWEEMKRQVRERREAAGLPVRSATEKQAAMDRLMAEVRACRPAELPLTDAGRKSPGGGVDSRVVRSTSGCAAPPPRSD
ncbi:hypothetical protein SRB5_45050 [Streptomyces sp. RB5]|uniref:Uncharacterized protein n=1 Tax=Streptomyces smaragdinus TaxID=2585196 RepID=A0A7K0CLQ1_9ACTN|nr:hypothetical protein [Streptomyces smaragdinus]